MTIFFGHWILTIGYVFCFYLVTKSTYRFLQDFPRVREKYFYKNTNIQKVKHLENDHFLGEFKTITYNNLSFKYNQDQDLILENLDFRINKNDFMKA